jgi:hypothetical protein
MVIAREVDKATNKIYYGYAICMPKDYRTSDGRLVKGLGDTFDRKRGRDQAEGRMKAMRYQGRNADETAGVVPMLEGQHPSDTLYRFLANNDRRAIVKRMMFKTLEEIDEMLAEKNQ